MRWYAEIDYLTESGVLIVPFSFEEIEDLHGLVELGPNFYAITKITIALQPNDGLTGRTLESLESE